MKSSATNKVKKKATKKSASKRQFISPNGDARYVRRDKEGQFQESDDAGRSQKADRLKKAERVAKSGEGDKGDPEIARKKKAKN